MEANSLVLLLIVLFVVFLVVLLMATVALGLLGDFNANLLVVAAVKQLFGV